MTQGENLAWSRNPQAARSRTAWSSNRPVRSSLEAFPFVTSETPRCLGITATPSKVPAPVLLREFRLATDARWVCIPGVLGECNPSLFLEDEVLEL